MKYFTYIYHLLARFRGGRLSACLYFQLFVLLFLEPGAVRADTTNDVRFSVQSMRELPNLKYSMTLLEQGRKRVVQFEWKRSEQKIYSRVLWVNQENRLIPAVTYLNDGENLFEIYENFAIKRPVGTNEYKSFEDYYFPERLGSKQYAYENPQPGQLGTVSCWRFARLETNDVLALPGARDKARSAVFRSDYVERATGYWIGYTLSDASGKIDSSYFLSNISTNEIPQADFDPPQAPFQIRSIASEKDREKAFLDGMQPRLEKFGLKQAMPLGRVMFTVAAVITPLIFLATWAYQRARKAKTQQQ